MFSNHKRSIQYLVALGMILVGISLTVMLVDTVNAQVDISSEVCDVTPGTGEVPEICKDINTEESANPIFGPNGIVTGIINFLSLVTGAIAVVIIIVSGIRLVISRGDSNKIAAARSSIIYACVGLVVVALAQAIVQLVLNRI